jgi:hypothetical protein
MSGEGHLLDQIVIGDAAVVPAAPPDTVVKVRLYEAFLRIEVALLGRPDECPIFAQGKFLTPPVGFSGSCALAPAPKVGAFFGYLFLMLRL